MARIDRLPWFLLKAKEFVSPPVTRQSLGDSDLHVWAHSLHRNDEMQVDLLSKRERERAGRFRSRTDRRRFVQSHIFLHQILAQYMYAHPGDVAFQYSDRGKPSIRDHPDLNFSLSHSGEVALVAVTRIGRIGVDVEFIRLVPNLVDVARHAFSPNEFLYLMELDEDVRVESFFRLWTRKEALIKAIGCGWTEALFDIEVSLNVDSGLQMFRIGDPSAVAQSCVFQELRPARHYVGAVIADLIAENIYCWRYN